MISPNYQTDDDHALLRRAINYGWPVSQEIKEAVVQECEALLTHQDPSHRSNAIKSLVMMERTNVQLHIATLPRHHTHDHRHLIQNLSNLELQEKIKFIRQEKDWLQLTQVNPTEYSHGP